ncbi:hypothetical protein C8R47DRAFT_1216656 [Mycena vitilis]|nr:hypothetical protein C8R47DRAFT_1216656 [Mycena vitilis]
MDDSATRLSLLSQPYFLPRFHLSAHQAECSNVFPLRPTTAAATNGESVESGWALLSPLATSTRSASTRRRVVSKQART